MICDLAIDDDEIADLIAPVGRIDDAAVANDRRVHVGDSSAQIKDGHSHGETVGDLIENDALRAVGHFAVDFDPSIDRPGMHDQASGFNSFARSLVKPKSAVYSPRPGKYSLR